MFLGEALGLRALGASGSMAVPEVFAFEDGFEGGSFLIMEYMDMSGRPSPELFGRKMAEMHLAEPLDREAKAGRFGFKVDNTIGSTPQPNVRVRSSNPGPPRGQHLNVMQYVAGMDGRRWDGCVGRVFSGEAHWAPGETSARFTLARAVGGDARGNQQSARSLQG